MRALRGSGRLQISIAIAMAAACAVARADEPPPAEGEVLPELLVTTQKIKQTLEQVPASVSAINGEMIRDSQGANFADLQDYTSNVVIRLSGGAGQFTIRGFGTQDTNPAFDPSVGNVIDGVFYGRTNFLAGFFYDIDRFEVLRGPQGTLFGKNNTAGVFNLVTEAPSPRPMMRWELLAAADGQRSFRPVINLPLGGNFSLRISGNYDHGDRGTLFNTFLKRGERGVQQDSTRVRLRYTSDSGAVVTDLAGFYSHVQQNFNQFEYSKLGPNMLALQQSYDPSAEAIVNFQNSSSYRALEDAFSRGASLTVDDNLGALWGSKALRLTSITSAASIATPKFDLDADFSAVPFITDTMAVPRAFNQLSQEVHLSGEVPSLLGWGRGVTFVFGAYYYQSHFKTSDFFNIEDLGAAYAYETAAQCDSNGVPVGVCGTQGGILHGPLEQILTLLNPVTSPIDLSTSQNASVKLDQHAKDYALFGQAEHRIFEDWYLIGGLRFDIESKRGDASSLAHGRLIPLIANQKDHNTHIERIEHQLSPKAGFKWSPNKHVEAYGTWTRGFKSGGFNALPLKPDNLEYDPERATSIELGGKVRVLGGALRFSGAVFTTNFDNLQVSTFQNNSFIVENAANARSRGFEIDLHWLTPLDGVAFYTSVGLADAKYVSYPCAPAASDSTEAAGQAHCHPTNSTGNPVTDTAGQITGTVSGFLSPTPPTQDLAGHPLAFAPKWTATVIPSYTLQLPHYMAAVFAVDVLYRSAQFLNPDNDDRKTQPATTQLNARIGIGDLTKNWKLTIVGHNLTDKIVLDQAVDEPLAPGGIAVVRSDRGRFYSANLAITF